MYILIVTIYIINVNMNIIHSNLLYKNHLIIIFFFIDIYIIK